MIVEKRLDTDDDGPPVEARDPMYFGYYSMLMHQQNMLQDHVRTSTYFSMINTFKDQSFHKKIVMDVGAGSGVLSFFSAMAGASTVYAVEASAMAHKLKLFLNHPSAMNETWKESCHFDVVNEKIEHVSNERIEHRSVDTIVSEPIGVLLVHERMLESFIYARDHFLKPGGDIYPTTGTIQLAPFMDASLWMETNNKVQWWNQQNFYNIDMTAYMKMAREETFSMPVVGPFPAQYLLTNNHHHASHTIDFRTITQSDLHAISIPLNWQISYTGLIHGIAGWFDIDFFPTDESKQRITMTTHPGATTTHWQQARFLFSEPVAVNAGDVVRGNLVMHTNAMRSYSMLGEVWVEDGNGEKRMNTIRTGKWELQDQTYHYPPVVTPGQPLST